MSENKFNSKAFIMLFLSGISYLAAYLIYAIVPSSELANGLSHPGITAVYVLTASPVLAILALVLLVTSYILNKEYFEKLFSKSVTVSVLAFLSILITVSVFFIISFLSLQYKLGFVAPIYGTKWSSFAVYMLISVILYFLSLLLVTLKMKGTIK